MKQCSKTRTVPVRIVFAATLILELLAGCAATEPLRLTSENGQAVLLSEEESRLWYKAKEADDSISNRGMIYKDPELTAYLQSVMDELYPEFSDRVRVNIIKSPILNAFSLPNGSVYVHLGMLARLENEAQLATVLAHEGAHFVKHHALLQMRTLKSMMVAANVIYLSGIPLVGELAAISSMYGYSQDLERDADRVGWNRLLRAGYDGHEAEKTFRHLLEEVEALNIDEPVFFSSHPKLQERIKSFRELAEAYENGGRIGKAEFLAQVGGARIAALEADLRMGRCDSVIRTLTASTRLKHYPPWTTFYLGEAYRRRGEIGDHQKAIDAYRITQKNVPDYAPTYRALGLMYLKDRNFIDAQSNFQRYLEMAPYAADRAYVKDYLEITTKEVGKP